jgi:gliding motility-associated-like protein
LLNFNLIKYFILQLKLQYCFYIIGFLSCTIRGQDVSLYQQFNGRYDFVFIGNTLNPEENSYMSVATINTSSTANLNLGPNDIIQKAYLYWAGCGPGDFDVKLNNHPITPDQVFTHHRNSFGIESDYFSAFTDVTTQVLATGNGTYTLSELDLNQWIDYYFDTRTNFGGWAIIIIYKNNSLPQNQLNIYHGLQAVPDVVNITLNSLNVIDNQNAKIGFLAWEGDENLAVNESLRINGNLISNPPLNPPDNAFNGTNSFTNDANLHNMDLDVYDIQNNIHIGDTSAQIDLTSGQDFVMINAVVTKLNSQLPDATIAFNTITTPCNSRDFTVNYTVFNSNATAPLHAGIPIAIYINGVFFQYTETLNQIAVDSFENGSISLSIPATIASPFEIKFVVDDTGNGTGIVTEISETNNSFSQNVTIGSADPLHALDNLVSCNKGLGKGTFDFSNYATLIKQNATDTVTFFTSLADLQSNSNPILDPSNYTSESSPFTIFVKVNNGTCYTATSFIVTTTNCPPTIYNFISANSDFINDTFHIEGLRDVFTNFKLDIYNRWGVLVWEGNNNLPDWDGHANEGILLNHAAIPDGTYYYVLELNDPNYPKPFVGYLYLTR